MRDWSAGRIAELAGAQLVHGSTSALKDGPRGVSIDSRAVAPGDLFVGLRGERTDGGEHAAQALADGAWGVLVTPHHTNTLDSGVVLAHEQPLEGLQRLAAAWREELRERGAKVLAITGSTGKTSTKDILAALLAQSLRTSFSSQNMNTEIGLPLALLAAPADTQALVLEMAMRGQGQIAELAAVARPDVGVIVNVGPAHLGLLGSLEAIAAAKAELIAGLAPGATAIVPADEPLLSPHLREDLETVTFGAGGDVSFAAPAVPGEPVRIRDGETELVLEPSFEQAHQLRNLLAAVAAARAIGVTPRGRLEVEFSAMRGQRTRLAADITLIDDSYNANPMSTRAALDELARAAGPRRVAVLGDMLELGEQAPELHREIGRHAQASGVSLLVAVGPLAREMADAFDGESVAVDDAAAAAQLVPTLLGGGETVLVKGSRGIGLDLVSAALRDTFAPLEDAVTIRGRS
ncbi:MAG TPA: UDP-N-acetylmuramoyl-tripeptide--D-alanyl-D-alanine ligase [Solirubrobacteraceae bacterium]|jgi:UDP-N-acetylmuramoyl-tripeptide--D-alanyl-D-alanine ligase